MPFKRYARHAMGLVACASLAGCAGIGPKQPTESEQAEAQDAEPASVKAAVPETRGMVPPPEPTLPPLAVPRTAPAPPVTDSEPAAELPPTWQRYRANLKLGSFEHDRIGAELKRYAGRQSYFNAVTERAEPYLNYILDRLEARDLPAALLMVPVVESGFRPFAYSRSHAGGLWQFKAMTGRRFGLVQNGWYDGRRDVVASTEAALDYLEYLHGFFNGDWLLAIAAYNAGEGRVRQAVRANRAQGQPTDYWHLDLPAQTEKYVPRVLALRRIFAEPGAYNVQLPPVQDDAALHVVELDRQVDLAVAAEMADVDLETLYRYNSGLNRWSTPPEGPHRLALPAGRAEAFRAALEQREPSELVRWRRHTIAQGETLSEIARTYDTDIDALRALNELSGSMIRAGDHLLVPAAGTPGGGTPSAPTASGDTKRITYRVRRGDTLWGIARDHGVDVDALTSWNDLSRSRALQPGQKLSIRVPASQSGRGGPRAPVQRVDYTVRSGDSLYAIAERFNVDVADIRVWNDLTPGAYLQPGQELTLRIDVTQQPG